MAIETGQIDARLPDGGRGWWSRHPRAVRLLAAVAVVWGVVYLTWRIGWTGAGAQPVSYWFLVGAELFGWVSLSLYVLMAWRVPRTPRPAITTERSVDVFVCTYDEPVEVVHATLAGCNAIRRPHRTYLLDDGRREEMRRLAAHLGVGYLTRPDNAHAKAGNINAALPRTDGELIATLDADHVPMPDYLEATVGYFEDPDVALVQTPHDFYNRDSMQHTREWRHEQTLFYEVTAPGKDRLDSIFWCGSAAVLRRRALKGVGGVRTDTVAEDFHTTIALHAQGWKSHYHHETLVQGLAPHDLAAFLLQRDRWARGNLRVFRTKENPVTCRGLDLRQRLSYFASLLNYFSGLQRLTLLAVLLLTLFTGLLPLHATVEGLVVFWLPWSLLAFTATVALSRGTLGAGDSTRYGLLTMGIFSRAALSLVVGQELKFKVTPKEGVDHGGLPILRALPLATIVALALGVGVVARLVTWLGPAILPPLSGLALGATLVLGVYELTFLAATLVPLLRRRQLRTSWRFRVELSGTVGGQPVQVFDLSPRGFALDAPAGLSVADGLTLALELPAPDGTAAEVRVPAVVASETPASGGRMRLGCQAVDVDSATNDRLVDFCYVVQPFQRLRGEDALPVPLPGALTVEPDPLAELLAGRSADDLLGRRRSRARRRSTPVPIPNPGRL